MSIESTKDLSTITDAEVFDAHLGGKLSVQSKMPLNTKRDLSIAYTPGVAKVSQAIADNPSKHATHTSGLPPGRRRLRRHRSTGSGQHWCGSIPAGDGRQERAVQGIRGTGLPSRWFWTPPMLMKSSKRSSACAQLRCSQPGRHLRPALLRN